VHRQELSAPLLRRRGGRRCADSDGAALLEAIKTKLLTLPDETLVYGGHGPATTIGQERRYNPFL
jgi:glyoxylase-like metal-dependent hydrolase (beta-lactamase superfamily II)